MVKLIEDAIAAISPSLASRRARASAERAAWRKKEELVGVIGGGKRLYAGAQRGRTGSEWLGGRGTSADTEVATGGQTLRDRANDLVRNDAFAQMIVTRHVDNIVGTGITPKARTGDPVKNKIVDELWTAFAKRIDPAGQLNWDGMTSLAVRSMITGGEAFARKRMRRPSDGLAVPLQVQLLEPEFVDGSKLSTYSANSQNVVVSGIEFDLLGARRGYWMFRQHPGSANFNFSLGRDSVFVPASDVVHLYEQQRSQVRGASWLAPCIEDLGDLKDYNRSEMVRKKTEACMVGFVIPGDDDPEGEDPNVGLPLREDRAVGDIDLDHDEINPQTAVDGYAIEDLYGDPVERFEPGMFAVLRGGKDIKFHNPEVSTGHEAWVRTQLRRITAGARIPYEIATGDLSQVTFASGKMGTNEYRAFVSGVQWKIVIPQWCQPVWDWFVDAIKLAGLVDAELMVGVDWSTPKFQSINQLDDAKGDLVEVRSGFKSWDDAVAERGYDPDETAAKIVARNAFWDANKVTLDVDPRRVSFAGQAHQQAAKATDGQPTDE